LDADRDDNIEEDRRYRRPNNYEDIPPAQTRRPRRTTTSTDI